MSSHVALRLLFTGCLVVLSKEAHAQASAASGDAWYGEASVVQWTTQRAPDRQPCDFARFSQGGGFCTGPIGMGAGLLGSVGRSFAPRLSLEAEGALSSNRAAPATYYRYAGRFDTDRTDALYSHRDVLLSAVMRVHLMDARKPISLDPIVGMTFAWAHGTLSQQTRVRSLSVAPFSLTSFPSDNAAGAFGAGISTGADLGIAVGARTALIATVRLRWVSWNNITWPDARLRAGVGVGRFSAQFGGGIRWSQRRR